MSCGPTDISVELRIEDDGSGIEPEVLPHVFDRFYRSDPSRSRKTGGTGLGLAICKAIVIKARGTHRYHQRTGPGNHRHGSLPQDN